MLQKQILMRSRSLFTMILLTYMSVSCGNIAGGGNNDNNGNEVVVPNGDADQTLVTLASLIISPSRKISGPIADIEYLLESTTVNVTGFREIILYGVEVESGLPNCKTTDGTLIVQHQYFGVGVYFSLSESGRFLKGSETKNISELSRHAVSGNFMTVEPGWGEEQVGTIEIPAASSSNSSEQSPVDTSKQIIIDQTTCSGQLELKVVGVKGR